MRMLAGEGEMATAMHPAAFRSSVCQRRLVFWPPLRFACKMVGGNVEKRSQQDPQGSLTTAQGKILMSAEPIKQPYHNQHE